MGNLAGSLEVTGSARNYFGHAENVELTLDGFKERCAFVAGSCRPHNTLTRDTTMPYISLQ